MSFDLGDVNQQFMLVLLAAVLGFSTCGVVTKCCDSVELRAEAEVRKACIYKTGNPECKR